MAPLSQGEKRRPPLHSHGGVAAFARGDVDPVRLVTKRLFQKIDTGMRLYFLSSFADSLTLLVV